MGNQNISFSSTYVWQIFPNEPARLSSCSTLHRPSLPTTCSHVGYSESPICGERGEILAINAAKGNTQYQNECKLEDGFRRGKKYSAAEKVVRRNIRTRVVVLTTKTRPSRKMNEKKGSNRVDPFASNPHLN